MARHFERKTDAELGRIIAQFNQTMALVERKQRLMLELYEQIAEEQLLRVAEHGGRGHFLWRAERGMGLHRGQGVRKAAEILRAYGRVTRELERRRAAG
jgi:Ni,Fe-hydrogenase I large subunit